MSGYIQISYQRLRNLTTGRLHTCMDDVYDDMGQIIGDDNLNTIILPAVRKAILPYLSKHVTDSRFWDDECDSSHKGIFKLLLPSYQERAEMNAAAKKALAEYL
jgi:hypothetical protein